MANSASAQVVGYVGSSVCNLFKLGPHLDAQGYNVQDVIGTVMAQLNEQLDPRTLVSGGQHVGLAADLGTPTVGTAQNSGLSNSLA